jgi:hypothetical protein
VASSYWTINNSSQLSSVVHCGNIREIQVTDIFEGTQFRYLDLRTLFGAVFVGLHQGREDVAAASRSLSLFAIAAVASAVRVAVRQNIFSFCVTRIRDRTKKVFSSAIANFLFVSQVSFAKWEVLFKYRQLLAT